MRALIHSRARVTLAVLLLAALAGCGGSGNPLNRSGAGFNLNVLPTSFELGGSAQFTLSVDDSGSPVKVDVLASNAHGLKAAYVDLGYDAATYTPLGAQSTGLLATGSQRQIVELSLTGEPGTVHHGEVLALPQSDRGFTGGGVVATFTFARRPMPRAASVAPRNKFSKTQLSWASPGVLTWRFSSAGDYDQNGEVNISDLTPLSTRLWHTAAPATFAFDSMDSVCDGDQNGEVNMADITPIGANYGVSARKYFVYGSPNEIDYPVGAADPEVVEPLAEVAIEGTQDTPGQTRLSYSYIVSAPQELEYFWVRPADLDGTPGQPSNSVQFESANIGPTASIVPDKAAGIVPFTVNFNAGGSSDSDGNIIKYEFDWDGPGTVYDWEDKDTQSLVSHQFTTGGSFEVTVRVTDDDGARSTAVTTIDSVVQEEPTAVIDADKTFGMAPLSVNFSAASSTDNGSIVIYEWDLDGDGTFELNSGAVPVIAHDYFSSGTFAAAVRVTDNDSLTATDQVTVTVTPAAGSPVAALDADVTIGTVPFSVNFDASGSSDDGTIDLYEWDYDGDGIFDAQTTSPTISTVYTFAGSYSPTLRVTDNDNQTDTASVQISAQDPAASGAKAILTANPRYGPAPLQVYFDASHSYSTDGAIMQYEWDWDGDGTYDESGATAKSSHEYQAPGTFDAKVRVTDANSGTDEKVMLVFVTTDDSFPPDDSVFALPTQSFASAGDAVGIEVYCKGSASPLEYIAGLRMTMPAGNTYVSSSYDTGAIGGASPETIDGLWAQMMPTMGFLYDDSFIQISDIGGGQEAIDLNVTPLGGSNLNNATGALCNFELNINNDSSFGFQRINGVYRTYYYDENQSQQYFWSNENVPGLPPVDVQ